MQLAAHEYAPFVRIAGLLAHMPPREFKPHSSLGHLGRLPYSTPLTYEHLTLLFNQALAAHLRLAGTQLHLEPGRELGPLVEHQCLGA